MRTFVSAASKIKIQRVSTRVLVVRRDAAGKLLSAKVVKAGAWQAVRA